MRTVGKFLLLSSLALLALASAVIFVSTLFLLETLWHLFLQLIESSVSS